MSQYKPLSVPLLISVNGDFSQSGPTSIKHCESSSVEPTQVPQETNKASEQDTARSSSCLVEAEHAEGTNDLTRNADAESNSALGPRGQFYGDGDDDNNAVPQRFLFKVISSGLFFKCIARMWGLWPGSKCLSVVSTFSSLCLVFFALLGESVVVFACKHGSEHFNDSFCVETRRDVDLSSEEYKAHQFLRFLAVLAQALCFVVMCISIRRRPFAQEALPLEQAYKLVKPERWVVINGQLFGFLALMITSDLLNFCCSADGTCAQCYAKVIIFYAVLSIVLWLTIVSCFVFATVINGLVVAAKQCSEQILEMECGTVNDAIEIHQRFCNTAIFSVKRFHVWFLLNSACYFWLTVYLVIIYLSQGGNTKSWSSSFQMSVLFVYSMFSFLHPWLTASRLTTAYGKLTRMLNATCHWKPSHPFNDRSQLDSFVLYASNTQCRFSQITCSSSLPYISVFLALCGLGLRFFQ